LGKELGIEKEIEALLAAKSAGVLDNAAFAQKTFGQTFSSGGKFAGQTIDDVAGALRSGSMKVGDVPIEYIVRNGNTLMLNTRSAQALQQAGIPRSQWNAVNMTGNAAAEARLTEQLQRNGLGGGGIPNPTSSGR
jgi:filamentous hemagglutinin